MNNAANSCVLPDKAEKPAKTPEELAQIAFLDDLRFGRGEEKPVGLPLACVVKVVESVDVPKANEAYALVTVEGKEGRRWRLCVYRGTVTVGKNALFVSEDAALPFDERWRNPDICTVKDKTFRFGFGVSSRRFLPFVKHNIYRHNSGVLYPLAGCKELKRSRVGTVCSALLNIDSRADLERRAAPRPSNPKFITR